MSPCEAEHVCYAFLCALLRSLHGVGLLLVHLKAHPVITERRRLFLSLHAGDAVPVTLHRTWPPLQLADQEPVA